MALTSASTRTFDGGLKGLDTETGVSAFTTTATEGELPVNKLKTIVFASFSPFPGTAGLTTVEKIYIAEASGTAVTAKFDGVAVSGTSVTVQRINEIGGTVVSGLRFGYVLYGVNA